MEPQNPYAAPTADDQTLPEQPRGYYMPLEGRATWASMAIVATLVFDALALIVPGTGETFWDNDGGLSMSPGDFIGILDFIAGLGAVVMVCFFFPQANRNARVLAEDIRFTPASTAWWFFVPVLNLIRPYQAVAELWTSSGPIEVARWKIDTPLIIKVWWGGVDHLGGISEFWGRQSDAASLGLYRRRLADLYPGRSCAAAGAAQEGA